MAGERHLPSPRFTAAGSAGGRRCGLASRAPVSGHATPRQTDRSLPYPAARPAPVAVRPAAAPPECPALRPPPRHTGAVGRPVAADICSADKSPPDTCSPSCVLACTPGNPVTVVGTAVRRSGSARASPAAPGAPAHRSDPPLSAPHSPPRHPWHSSGEGRVARRLWKWSVLPVACGEVDRTERPTRPSAAEKAPASRQPALPAGRSTFTATASAAQLIQWLATQDGGDAGICLPYRGGWAHTTLHSEKRCSPQVVRRVPVPAGSAAGRAAARLQLALALSHRVRFLCPGATAAYGDYSNIGCWLRHRLRHRVFGAPESAGAGGWVRPVAGGGGGGAAAPVALGARGAVPRATVRQVDIRPGCG
eukprot:ctg_2018.g553